MKSAAKAHLLPGNGAVDTWQCSSAPRLHILFVRVIFELNLVGC